MAEHLLINTSDGGSGSVSSSPAGVGLSASCRRPPRAAWFIYVTKTKDVYDVHIGYKNSTGDVSEYCPTPNASVKIPFGTPVKCEFIVTREAEESSLGEFQFTSKRREIKKFKLSQLNCFEGGDNAFSKKITKMVIDKNEEQLAKFLSLLPHSSGFSMHRAELHSDHGELLEDLIADGSCDSVEDDATILNDYESFVSAAIENAREITRKSTDIRSYFGTKRKSDSDVNHGRKSKATIVLEREMTELQDNDGLEREYQQSFVGLTNIPLENINIAADLESKVNNNRVDLIIESMLVKYDPSLTIPVVCPEDGQAVLDLKNVKDQKFSAIQKIHTIAALKKLDKEGKFCNMISHKKRMVPCYVLKMSSSGLIHYGNMRSNDITYQFSRKTSPQDLVRTFHSLSAKEGFERAAKITERMAGLARIGPNEFAALRKLTSWKPDGLKALIEVLTKYEAYESMDKKPKGYQKMLFEGKKMTMPNDLFKQLGRTSEEFFLASYKKILNSESSLKSCLEDYEIERKMQNVTAVLSIFGEYTSYENLKLKHPGKFEFQQLKDFFGAEIKKDGKKNKQAEQLEMYYESVITGECFNDFKAVEISSLSTAFNDHTIDMFKVVTVHLADQEDYDLVCAFVMRRANLTYDFHATIVLFFSEMSQQEALSFWRTMLKDKEPMIKIKPLFFSGYEKYSGEFLENLQCGIIVGNFNISKPFKMHHDSISKLPEIVENLSTTELEMAVIAVKNIPILQLHSNAIQVNLRSVTYFGSPEDLEKVKTRYKAESEVPSETVSAVGGAMKIEDKSGGV